MTPRQPRQRRRGTLYLSVLGTAMMVSIAGLCAMHVARSELRATTGNDDTTRARLAAEAGVEYALAETERLANWRADFKSGVNYPSGEWIPVGADSEFQFVFDAGLRADSTVIEPNDPDVGDILLRGIGRSGDSVSVVETTLSNDGAGYNSLAASLASRGDIILEKPIATETEFFVDQVVYSGNRVDKSSGSPTIHGDVEAVGVIQNNIATGTETEGVPAREFPSNDIVFDYYRRRGTWIDINALGGSGANRTIDRQVLTPELNQISSETNPEGIYVIDCQGASVHITNARIIGTLVLLNNADDSSVTFNVAWSPAADNYPALMVQNGFSLSHDSTTTLRENSLGVNFNPPGAPSNGIEDADTGDQYTSHVNGLIYVGGKLTVFGLGSPIVNGVILCNEAEIRRDFTINHRSIHLDFPPPGFSGLGAVTVQSGSWRRGSN